jgi:hypothetical protein
MAAPDLHPLDRSLALSLAAPNLWHSESSDLYWNAIGHFGGWMASMLLHAVLSEPTARGDPVSLQVQFIGPMQLKPFDVRTALLRQNRTTAFWRSEIVQVKEPGAAPQVCAHAAVTLSDWRDTPAFADAVMPAAAAPESLPIPYPRRNPMPEFLKRYDFRVVRGDALKGADRMDSTIWARDSVPRTLDARSVAALCDAPIPSLWMRLTEPLMMTTLIFNVFFRVPAGGFTAAGDAHVLLDSHADLAQAGFFDQHTNVWSRGGVLLAQTQQLAWFADRASRSAAV